VGATPGFLTTQHCRDLLARKLGPVQTQKQTPSLGRCCRYIASEYMAHAQRSRQQNAATSFSVASSAPDATMPVMKAVANHIAKHHSYKHPMAENRRNMLTYEHSCSSAPSVP